MRLLCSVTLVVSLVCLGGCGRKDKGHAHDHDDHGHVHERGQLKIADAGNHHATLTAHRSKKGNELDLAFETQDEKNPRAVALPLASIAAEAITADGKRHELTFEPAPADERPKDEKEGTCSKFSAKAPWLKTGEKIDLVARVKMDGKDVTIRFTGFDPQKYGHDAY